MAAEFIVCYETIFAIDEAVEDELAVVSSVLGSFGPLGSLQSELHEVRRKNKKLRFREQRFARHPLLRRRRMDTLTSATLKVLVVALQNAVGSQGPRIPPAAGKSSSAEG